jgi:hypothetical protein
MGAWGHLAFDNDSANDWAYGLDVVADLSLVEAAFDELEEVGDDYLDQDIACAALAACEVLARCRGNPGYTNAYTKKVDTWVAEHRPLPSAALVKRALASLDRLLGERSELRELWAGLVGEGWRASIEDLRQRLSSPAR